jgi:hypothetical protein
MYHPHLTIRGATPDDARTLRRLVELDSTRQLTGRVLLAELDGAPVAALSLSSGAVAADPFQHSAVAVHELRARRYRILRQGGDVAQARSLLRRLAAMPAG